jgi:hypothetical protein
MISFDKRQKRGNMPGWKKRSVKCLLDKPIWQLLRFAFSCGKPFYVSFAIEGFCHNHSR